MAINKESLITIKRQEISRLIKKIAKKDLNALELLYEKTRHSVYGLSISILKDHSKAEDIMQDVYIKILDKAETYKNEKSPMSWIFKITKNLCLMEIRKSRNKDVNIDEFYDIKDNENTYKNLEDKMILKRMLRVLTAEERQIVVMYTMVGMKHKEIAKELSMPISTVLSKYSRSLKKLKEEENEII